MLILFARTSSRQEDQVTASRDLWHCLIDILVTVASTCTSCEQVDQPAHEQPTELYSSDRDPQTDALEQTVPPDSTLSGLPPIALVVQVIPQNSADPGTL